MQKSKIAIFVMLTFMLMVSVAHAALPTVIGTGITGIQTDALAIVDLIWPVVTAVVGAFILFKLFKRGAAKV